MELFFKHLIPTSIILILNFCVFPKKSFQYVNNNTMLTESLLYATPINKFEKINKQTKTAFCGNLRLELALLLSQD